MTHSARFYNLPISKAQAYSVAESDARVNVWEGSVRSGKTYASILRWFMFLANPPVGGQLVMVGRTRDSVARNVIAAMSDPNVFGSLAHTVKYVSGAPFATILGRRVYVMGASDINAEKVIRGLTLAGAYVDEITVLREDFFTQLLGRMSVDGAQLFGTTNPDNPEHWLKRTYLDRMEELNAVARSKGKPDVWRSWHFQLDDNPALSDDYKDSIKSEFTGLFYKRFIEGQWVAAEGAVFDMWDAAKHVVPWCDLPRIVEYFAVGVDYGTTNPTAAILLGIGENNILYAVDEWRYQPLTKALRLTDSDLSRQLRQWLTEPHHPLEGNESGLANARLDGIPVVVDPAAASFRVQLLSDGQPTAAADNNVLYGIRLMSSMLAAGKLQISDRCTGLVKEMPGYVWDKKATDKGEDAVIKINDHCLTAGTQVTTLGGTVNIEDLNPGGLVLTRFGYRRVLDAWKVTDSAPVWQLDTTNGATIRGTANHRVWTENRKWVRMDALQPGDTLVTCNTSGENTPLDTVKTVTNTNQHEPVYDITVEGCHEFFANSILVHNSIDAFRYSITTTEKRWRRYQLGETL